jgi:hypothetical protein
VCKISARRSRRGGSAIAAAAAAAERLVLQILLLVHGSSSSSRRRVRVVRGQASQCHCCTRSGGDGCANSQKRLGHTIIMLVKRGPMGAEHCTTVCTRVALQLERPVFCAAAAAAVKRAGVAENPSCAAQRVQRTLFSSSSFFAQTGHAGPTAAILHNCLRLAKNLETRTLFCRHCCVCSDRARIGECFSLCTLLVCHYL